MNLQPGANTVRHAVVVDAPIEKAFKVFTEDFGRFKPPEHNLLGVEIAETIFEDRTRPRQDQRGRGPLHRRVTDPYQGRARAPQPGPSRRGLAGCPRRRRWRPGVAAVPSALQRAVRRAELTGDDMGVVAGPKQIRSAPWRGRTGTNRAPCSSEVIVRYTGVLKRCARRVATIGPGQGAWRDADGPQQRQATRRARARADGRAG